MKDFLEELLEEGRKKDPHFAEKVEETYRRRREPRNTATAASVELPQLDDNQDPKRSE